MVAALVPLSMPRVVLAAAGFVLASCGGGSAPASNRPAPQAPASSVSASPTPAPPSSTVEARCTEPPADAGRAAFERGQDIDADVDSGKRDTHLSLAERLDWYMRSAKAGYLDGQFEAGALSFGTLFTSQAPQASERADYVQALTYLFIAAFRGHDRALAIFPGMAELVDTGTLPDELKMPLPDIPREWLQEALEAARRWPCHDGGSPR